jgi:hypothetical protein
VSSAFQSNRKPSSVSRSKSQKGTNLKIKQYQSEQNDYSPLASEVRDPRIIRPYAMEEAPIQTSDLFESA